MPTRLMSFLILCLCVFGGQSRADEPICVHAPTVACLGKLAARHAKALARSEFWQPITQNLVLAGRADDAKALAGNLSELWHKSSLEETMAIAEVATNARATPLRETTLEPILRLDDFTISKKLTFSRYDRISKSYHLLALELLGEQPYARGGRPWLVDAEKAHARRSPPLPNATLQVVLKVWPEIIDKTSAWRRRGDWIELANAYSIARQYEEARRILQTLDQEELRPRLSWKLVRAWLRAGDPDRALAAAVKENDIERRANNLAEIASAYLSSGRPADALSTIGLGFASLGEKPGGGAVEAFVALLQEQHRAGDMAGAARRAEELARMAGQPHLLQPFNLARAAAVQNDLKQFAGARDLLERALAALPPADRVVGLGFHMGPIRYNRSGLGGEAIQLIAVELYRSGESARAVEFMKQAEPLFRMRACVSVTRTQLADPNSRFDPAALAGAIEPEYAAELLLVASALKVEGGDIGGARTLFQRALEARWQSDPDIASGLGQSFVRVAALLGEQTLVERSLHLSLKHALAIGNADRRTLHVTSLAAMAREVLPR
jgi:tetratricopeptide (TPR) repeat protein